MIRTYIKSIAGQIGLLFSVEIFPMDICSKTNVCAGLSSFFLGGVYIRFGAGLYRSIVGIPMGAYCTPQVADCFSFAMGTLSGYREAEVLMAFSLASGCLGVLMGVGGACFAYQNFMWVERRRPMPGPVS